MVKSRGEIVSSLLAIIGEKRRWEIKTSIPNVRRKLKRWYNLGERESPVWILYGKKVYSHSLERE